MKKLFVIMLTLVLAVCLAACTGKEPKEANNTEIPTTEEPTAEPTEIPTEAPTPEPTEAPTDTPTEEPTPEPTATPEPTPMPTEVPVEPKPLPEGDYFAVIRPDQPCIVDLDGDGKDEIVLLSNFSDEEFDEPMSRVIVVPGISPDAPEEFGDFYYEIIFAAVIDCDPGDGHREVIFAVQEEMAAHAYAVRVKNDGSGYELIKSNLELFDERTLMQGLPEDFVFNAAEGLPVGKPTELMGTNWLKCRATITENGFEIISDRYEWNYTSEFKLKRDIKLKTESGKTVTVKKGAKLIPMYTDLETYITFKLEDGTLGSAEISYGKDDWYPVYINGRNQDDYFRVYNV